MSRLYVAYGSNMVEDQMQVRCPDARLISREVLDGYALECRDIYSGIYLNAYKDDSSSIPVYVWDISADDEAVLDEYENYPESYIKVDVPTSQGMAMMYVMSDTVGKRGMPEAEYIQPVYDLYVEQGYPLDVIATFLSE